MKRRIKAQLKQAGIKTLQDLDSYARNHKQNGEIPSRYEVLCHLVGQNAAIAMLHELSIIQCCGKVAQ
jgi:hypothetical protein